MRRNCRIHPPANVQPTVDLTIKISAATGRPVGTATDTERYDSADRMRQDIAGAHWGKIRKPPSVAARMLAGLSF